MSSRDMSSMVGLMEWHDAWLEMYFKCAEQLKGMQIDLEGQSLYWQKLDVSAISYEQYSIGPWMLVSILNLLWQEGLINQISCISMDSADITEINLK